MASEGRDRKAGAAKAAGRKPAAGGAAVATSKKKTGAKKKSARARARRRATSRSTKKRHLFVVGEEERLERLVEGFGSNRVADLLEVSRSQPSRWRRGQEKLGPTSRRRVLDVDYVISRLLQLYPREQAEIWLTSHNAHLGGRPLDVLHLKGVAPVIAALDAEAEGAFA